MGRHQFPEPAPWMREQHTFLPVTAGDVQELLELLPAGTLRDRALQAGVTLGTKEAPR